DLLLNLHHYSPRLPLLLLSDLANEQLSQLPESLQERLLPLGDGSLHYQKLLDALQTARRIAGRPAGAPPLRSKLISDTGTALFRSLSGQSAAIQQVRQSLAQVATREASVLVIGESGTGKEIVARNIHYHSGRGEKPFV